MRENVFLRDTGVLVDPADQRAIEIVATGLPLAHGIPLAVDTTMVSPLHADGSIYQDAATQVGVALRRAEKKKRDTYPELVDSAQLRLFTAAMEVGGRLSKDATSLLTDLACLRSQSEPSALRASAARSLRRRWLTMISVVSQDAFAATLLNDGVAFLDVPMCPMPHAVDLWLDA